MKKKIKLSACGIRKGILLNYMILGLLTVASCFESGAQTLEEYQRYAAENNPGLQAKYKAFEASMQKTAQVNTLPDPNLSIGYFISPVETRVGPQRARFSLSQMFPWFGTLRLQGEAASLLADARYQEFLDGRNKLYYQVASAYFPLVELKRQIEIEAENIRILTSYKEIATVKFQNGKGSMVDVLRADLMLKEATTSHTILIQKNKPLTTRFNKLLNRAEKDSVFISDQLTANIMEEDYRRDSMLIENPLLEELTLKVKASETSEQAIIKQGLPKLGIGLDYVVIDKRTDMTLPDNGKDALMPMVTVSLPIFRTKYKAAKKEAQLMQESYMLQREDLSNQLSTSYDRIFFEQEKQLALLQLYDEQIQESQQSLNLLFSAYGNSGKDFEEVLRMQQQILKYQKMSATALAEYHVAKAELDYITTNFN